MIGRPQGRLREGAEAARRWRAVAPGDCAQPAMLRIRCEINASMPSARVSCGCAVQPVQRYLTSEDLRSGVCTGISN